MDVIEGCISHILRSEYSPLQRGQIKSVQRLIRGVYGLVSKPNRKHTPRSCKSASPFTLTSPLSSHTWPREYRGGD